MRKKRSAMRTKRSAVTRPKTDLRHYLDGRLRHQDSHTSPKSPQKRRTLVLSRHLYRPIDKTDAPRVASRLKKASCVMPIIDSRNNEMVSIENLPVD